jgi:3-oxoacyl-[acyl-carrier-protein] synthase-3
MRRCRTAGINWFCCGYSRAFALVGRRWAPRLGLEPDEYLLVVVAGRISRITDFSCRQTAGLFGDMASATMLAPTTSCRHPVHFTVVHADAEKQPADRPAFDFHVRSGVPFPAPDGQRGHADERLVYSLDGMAIAEIAPRAMSAAAAKALAAAGLTGADVNFVVPHQAGSGIVRFTGMKLEDHGIRGELINGLTRRTGNVSACSIPHALRETWGRLAGLIACPTAAVGSPGRPEVLQGCILLRATAFHERQATAAA